jgi:LysM repeat protein
VLLAVTAAVLAVHYGLQQKHAAPAPAAPVTRPVQHAKHHRKHAAVAAIGAGTYVVQRGDSFSIIAVKTRSTVSDLERLNPGISPTGLRVGQLIKVK